MKLHLFGLIDFFLGNRTHENLVINQRKRKPAIAHLLIKHFDLPFAVVWVIVWVLVWFFGFAILSLRGKWLQ